MKEVAKQIYAKWHYDDYMHSATQSEEKAGRPSEAGSGHWWIQPGFGSDQTSKLLIFSRALPGMMIKLGLGMAPPPHSQERKKRVPGETE